MTIFTSPPGPLHATVFLRLARNRHPHEAPPILALEVEVLPHEMRRLGRLSHFLHGIVPPLTAREEVVYRLRLRWGDGVLLDEVILLHDGLGILRRKSGRVDTLRSTHHEELGRVLVEVIPLLRGHDSSVELADLIVLGRFALVTPVTLAGDDVAGGLPRRFGSGHAGERGRPRRGVDRLVAVWKLVISSFRLIVDLHRPASARRFRRSASARRSCPGSEI